MQAPQGPAVPKAFGVLHASIARGAAVAKARPADNRSIPGMMGRERLGATVLNRSPAQIAGAEFSGTLALPPDTHDVIEAVRVIAQNPDGTTSSAEMLNMGRQAVACIAYMALTAPGLTDEMSQSMMLMFIINGFMPAIDKVETVVTRAGKRLILRDIAASTANRMQTPIAQRDDDNTWRDTFVRRFERAFRMGSTDALMRSIADGAARIMSVRTGELAVMLVMLVDSDAKDSIESTYQRYMSRRVRAAVNTAIRRIGSTQAALDFLAHPCFEASDSPSVISSVKGGVRELFLAAIISMQSSNDARVASLARLYLDRLLPYSDATSLQVLQDHVVALVPELLYLPVLRKEALGLSAFYGHMGTPDADRNSRVPLASYLHSEAAYLVSCSPCPLILGGAGLTVAKMLSKRFDDVTINAEYSPEVGTLSHRAMVDVSAVCRSVLVTGKDRDDDAQSLRQMLPAAC